MSITRIGLVGTGFIATQKHLPACQRLKGVAEATAVCDTNLDQAKEVARRFNVPNVYTDLDSMLKSGQVDIVDICTPPRTHAPIAVKALRGGTHVLIEKPMAVSAEECDRILAAADESGRKVCVAHSDLFYPSFMKARELVGRGEVGDFRGMRIFLSTPIDYMTSKPDHWANKLPGGVVGESGPHTVYLTLAFINPVLEVQAHGQKLMPEFPWSKFEDYRYDLIGSTGTCSVTLAYTTNQWAAIVDIWGTSGLLRLDLESQSLIRYRRSSLEHTTIGWSALRDAGQTLKGLIGTSARSLFGTFRSTHELLIRSFVESIRTGAPAPVTGEEGREAVRVMNLIVDQLEPVHA